MSTESFNLVLVGLFVLTFLTRFLPSMTVPTSFDALGHNLYARRLKQKKDGIFCGIELPVVRPKLFYHPFAWHWIIAKFNLDEFLTFHKYMNPLIDGAFIVVVTLVLSTFIQDKSHVIYIALFYATSPLLFTGLSIGPRANQFTPRLSAELIINTYFILLIYGEHFNSIELTLYLSALSVAGILWSKFSIQALIFISILFTVLSCLSQLTLWMVVLPSHILAFLFLALVSKGRQIKQLREQISHLLYYAKCNLSGETVISSRNEVVFLKKKKNQKFSAYLKQVAEGCLIHNSYLILIFKFPLILFVVFGLCTGLAVNVENSNVVLVCLASLGTFFFVNLKWFLFLGEAERYISNTCIVWIVAFVELYQSSGLFLHIVLWTYGLFFLCAELFINRLKARANKVVTADTEKFINYLNSLNEKKVILVLPNYLMGGIFRIGLTTDHTCLDGIYGDEIVRERVPIFLSGANGRNKDTFSLKHLVDIFGLNLIVADKDNLQFIKDEIQQCGDDWQLENINLVNAHIFKK